MKRLLEFDDVVTFFFLQEIWDLTGLESSLSYSKDTESTFTHYINLLKEKSITRSNQVWFADITYVRVKGGFGYCVAFMTPITGRLCP